MDIALISKLKHTCFSLIGKMCTQKDYQLIENHINNAKIKSNNVILDLSRLTYCTPHSLTIFVTISNILDKADKKVILFNPREEIQKLITMTRIDSIVPVVNTEKELKKLVL